MHPPTSLLSRAARGFTMAELMVSLSVISLTMIGVVAFTYQALNVYAYDSGRLLVNHDMRKFTGDMLQDAVYSNYFRIYTDFSTRATYQADSGTGDFLVLVFADTNTSSGITTVNRLIGYYRDPDSTTHIGPVRKFDVQNINTPKGVIIGSPTNTSADPPVYTMQDLLDTFAPAANAHTNGIVIQLAQGLASGNLFYNFKDHSIMIRGQINEQGNMIRKAVNTYNFTVSPRG